MSKYTVTFTSLVDNGNQSWSCAGTIRTNATGEVKDFAGRTIIYNNEAIMKIVENDQTAVRMEQSDFTRGERSSVARHFKLCRTGQVDWQTGQKTGAPAPKGLAAKVKELEAENATLLARIKELEEELGLVEALEQHEAHDDSDEEAQDDDAE